MTGKFPKHQIDHIDGNPQNNAWNNLREATPGQNRANSKSSAKSGFKGVCKTPSGKWVARITYNKRGHHIGTFDTPEEAHTTYAEAAKKVHGVFARLR